MKWKNSFKKGSLAAFVTLALTGSAWAMPTGGVVEQGSVNVDAANIAANDPIANVASGATITPQTNSIINWEAFNIAQGEALHFNTMQAALLNRVTGAQLSELLGQMTQVGEKPLYLVNPNGIHVGGTASFDVTTLVLSTLNMDTAEFNRPKGMGEWALKQGAQGAKELSIDAGAQLNIHNGGTLAISAGKVTVADGVTFVADSADHGGLYISAYKENTLDGTKQSGETEVGNTIDFRGKVSGVEYLEMSASSIHIEGAELAGKDIGIRSVAKMQGEKTAAGENFTMTAAPTNTLTLKNTKVASDQIHMLGGKVDVADDVKFKLDRDNKPPMMNVRAITTFSEEATGGRKNAATSQGNDVAFHGTVESAYLHVVPEINIGGATVNLDRAKFHTPEGSLSAVAIASSEDTSADVDGVKTEKSTTTATAANVVQADGLEIDGNWIGGTHIYAGKVDLKNTTIQTMGGVEIEACHSRQWTSTRKASSFTVERNLRTGTDNVVRLENTKIRSDVSDSIGLNNILIRGGNLELNNSEFNSLHKVNLMAVKSVDEVQTPVLVHSDFSMIMNKADYRADVGNNLQISNTKIQANRSWAKAASETDGNITVAGGKVSLSNDDLKGSGDALIYALREAQTPDGKSGTTKSSTSNTLDISDTKMEAGGVAEIWGGKVQMKKSSVQAGNIDIAAGSMKPTANNHAKLYATTDLSNTLYLEDVNLKSQVNAMGYSGETSLVGGQVVMKKAAINAAGVVIYSGQMHQGDDGSIYLTQGTPLHLDGTKIEAPSYRSLSSAANLVKGSEVKGQDVTFVAAQSYDGGTGKATVTKDNTLSLWGSKVEADRLSFLAGGVNAWKASEIKSQNAMSDHASDLVHADGSAFTMQRDETSHISEAGAELAAPRVSIAAAPKEPSSPLLPLTPDNAQLSEQDKENIDRGRSQATDIIASQAGTAAQSRALVEVVEALNAAPNASTRQTAGVVGGMLTAIAETSTLTTEEKQALQIAVLDAYGPVQEAKAESDHRTQQAKADADRMTTTEGTAAALPTAEEPQEAVHFVG